MLLTQTKLDLIKKIMDAKLTSAELKELNQKAEEIISKRSIPKNKK